MDESHFLEEMRKWKHPPSYGNTQFEEKVNGFSWRIRRVSSTTLRLVSGCRWSDEWLLVHVRKLHLPPSRWTQSQASLAEGRIIPNSTEVHWCFQNYSYQFGCQARETHRWLLEYRWVKRLVWSMDRFHSIWSFRRNTSKRILWSEKDSRENTWHRDQIIYGQNSGRQWEEMPSWRKGKSGHMKNLNSIMQDNYEESISVHLRTRNLRRPSRMLARNWKHWWLPLCPAKLLRTIWNVGVVHSIKSNQNLRVFWKLVNLQDCVWENHCRLIRKTILQQKGDISLQHYNLVHKFIRLPHSQAMKIPAAKAAVDKKWENRRKFRRGIWRKAEVRKRWSMKQGRRAQKFILHH